MMENIRVRETGRTIYVPPNHGVFIFPIVPQEDDDDE